MRHDDTIGLKRKRKPEHNQGKTRSQQGVNLGIRKQGQIQV